MIHHPMPCVVVAPRPASGQATAALVCGIFGFVAFCLVLPSAAAIVLGHLALRETKTGAKTGHGMAVAGLILGYVVVVPVVFAVGWWIFLAIGASTMPV